MWRQSIQFSAQVSVSTFIISAPRFEKKKEKRLYFETPLAGGGGGVLHLAAGERLVVGPLTGSLSPGEHQF